MPTHRRAPLKAADLNVQQDFATGPVRGSGRRAKRLASADHGRASRGVKDAASDLQNLVEGESPTAQARSGANPVTDHNAAMRAQSLSWTTVDRQATGQQDANRVNARNGARGAQSHFVANNDRTVEGRRGAKVLHGLSARIEGQRTKVRRVVKAPDRFVVTVDRRAQARRDANRVKDRNGTKVPRGRFAASVNLVLRFAGSPAANRAAALSAHRLALAASGTSASGQSSWETSMAVQIGAKPDSGFDDPIGMLTDCHRRIEQFLNILATVAERAAGRALTGEEAAAVGAALHYFRTGGVRHTADEEQSLFPRLRAESGGEGLDKLDALEADHETAADLHESVEQMYSEWMKNGAPSAERERELRAATDRLKGLYHAHIVVEESVVFPQAAKVLDHATIASIGQELRARRV